MAHFNVPLYHICDMGKVLLLKGDNFLHGIKKDGLTYYGKLLYETNRKI